VRLALKVDVDTLRGTREGVPALLRLFDEFDVRATFLFSLGPDHTGRALKRIFRPGFLRKVRRTSVASHYGIRTLLYGTLLPGPVIGRRCADTLRAVAAAGHETGIHCYDHVKWQDYVARRDAAWADAELRKAMVLYQDIFGEPASVHGAAGWQVNPATFTLEEKAGFRYASDTRGRSAFFPVMDGRPARCPQLPTTLPTLDELIGEHGVTAQNVHETVLAASRQPAEHGHVYTLHAELEGMQLLPVLRRLLEAWRREGVAMGTMAANLAAIDTAGLPLCEVHWGTVPGRSGVLAVQGEALA